MYPRLRELIIAALFGVLVAVLVALALQAATTPLEPLDPFCVCPPQGAEWRS